MKWPNRRGFVCPAAATVPLAGGQFWGGESEDHITVVLACASRPLELDEWAHPLSGRGWGSGDEGHLAKLTRWQALECLDGAFTSHKAGIRVSRRLTAPRRRRLEASRRVPPTKPSLQVPLGL